MFNEKLKIKKNVSNLIKFFIRNELTKKKISVFYYNIRILFLKKNKNCNFFEYEKLIKNKKHYCKDLYKGNFYYGISDELKKYSNNNYPVMACIEHGIYFGDFINNKEVINSGFSSIITFGDSRKNTILKYNPSQNVICIGPYIHYASPYLNKKEIEKIHNKNGKTLLVFPSHSIEDVTADYNENKLISEIQSFKKKYNFKTVIICLYYKDIENGLDKIYIKAGFTIVTAGRREDPSFLSRLKAIIQLSDYVMSNSVGTHIGYTIYLNKPHIIVQQNIKYKLSDISASKHIKNIYDDEAIKQKKEIYQAFSKYNKTITKEQISICDKYWGYKYIRTKEEMYSILKNLRHNNK